MAAPSSFSAIVKTDFTDKALFFIRPCVYQFIFGFRDFQFGPKQKRQLDLNKSMVSGLR